MKSVLRNIGIFSVLLYVAGVLTIGYLLTAGKQTDMLLRDAPEVIYITFGVIIVGFVAFLFLFLASSSNVEVIYVSDEQAIKYAYQENNTNLSAQTTQKAGTDIVRIENLILENQFNKKRLLEVVLREVCESVEATIGVMYIVKIVNELKTLEMAVSYALYMPEQTIFQYNFGEGLVGQVAKNGKNIKLTNIPDNYIEVVSGLGKASPNILWMLPIKNIEQEVLGVLEIASFKDFNLKEEKFLEEVALLLAKEIETNEYQNISI